MSKIWVFIIIVLLKNKGAKYGWCIKRYNTLVKLITEVISLVS